MKRLAIAILVSSFAWMGMTINAAVIDVDEAQSIARAFCLSGCDRLKTTPSSLVLTYTEPSEANPLAADYYVFNGNDSFVIIAGDDRAECVMAYGDGTLNVADLPCNLRWILDHYKVQIEYLLAHPDAVVTPSPKASTAVEPLTVCTWSQGEPYNDQCPTYKGKRCVTGCIATAMAQVMYYWRFPDELPDLPAYTSRTYHIPVPALPGTVLDWDNMLDGYSLNYTPAHGEAVATLMRYCGQGASMDYGTDGSGSGCWNQMVGMQVFGYNLSARLLHRDNYSAGDWVDLMLEDLTAGRPILYSGYGEAGGHAFVVDGYDGSRFSINWGWEGVGNNYFALDAFDVYGMSFSSGQEMIHNLYPEYYAEPWDFMVDGIAYNIDGYEATVTYRSMSANTYSGNLVIPEQVTHEGVTYPVTAIGRDAFRDCARLTGVTLPATIRRIGKYAFKDCTRLAGVTLPDGVELVDYGAFMECTALSSLSLGKGVMDIGYYAFYGCTSLRRLTIPDGVKSIGDCAFMDCTRLNQLIVGNGTERIGYAAFALDLSLTDVTIGNGTFALDDAVFYGCTSLARVELGENLEEIGAQAFHDCVSLERLTVLPELPPLMADRNTFDDAHYATTELCVLEYAWENYFCHEQWTLFANLSIMEDIVRPGDVNGDGEVNIADVNAVIDSILSSNYQAVMDVNGDGEVNIADVNALIDRILNG